MAVTDNSPLYLVLWICAGISAAFLAISTGVTWGMIEGSGGGGCSHMKGYVFLYHGICKHRTIEDEDDVKEHCDEWQDEKVWKNYDKVSDDVEFWNGADRTWEAMGALVPIAAGLAAIACAISILITICDSLKSWGTLSFVTLGMNLVAFVFALSALAAGLSSSQMSQDDWEDVSGCDVEVTWQGGFVLTFLATLGLFISTICNAVWKCQAK